MNEWMNECMNYQMNELMNEWINETKLCLRLNHNQPVKKAAAKIEEGEDCLISRACK